MKPSHLKTFLQAAFQARQTICITGRPGIGKTDIVTAACAALGVDLLVCHPVVDDPIDYKGLPGINNGNAEFLPYGNLRRMIDAPAPLVVFFDDLGQAAEVVQKALMQLLLSRTINGQPISKHVIFIAATNRKEDKAGVSGLLEPVKSRFTAIVELDVDLSDWVDWALDHALDPNVIAFTQARPNLLLEWKPTKDMTNAVCPRTLANLSKLTAMQLPDAYRLDAYTGAIGTAAAEFIAFESMADKLQDPRTILDNPATAPLPDHTRPDVIWCTSIGLAAIATDTDLPAMITYLDRMAEAGMREYAMISMRALYRRAPDACTNSAAWIKWASQNHHFIV
jgi:hypothetical protein